ncbi:MAG TPA: M14 family metallopeptidase [Chitinophagaceae bacterium]|nr:M14 family metallopeptidase [Chitinophagaceae bacterium]
MRKILLLTACWLVVLSHLHAQILSPEAFLGYKIGTRYTPHWKIVSYFQYVAQASPATVKLQQYGQTLEGRPLIVAFVGTEQHIARLDSIRLNNLRLAGLSGDRVSGREEDAPAIVWLSYNVHGDETSSSEAAMLMLYALVDPSNTRVHGWLANTVVVLDPCINPDGRDRYVNWFNSIVGNRYNPRLDAREHHQPWPGGRTNHYNFDLNRDWAWQTQPESRQRLQLYNQWLPQVHVDYHEQEIDAPYYFAPAAQPYHDVITPWQKTFQVLIGRNNARYFDANGWLFFTKEEFDLFYPSYGDTYPLYNGAIGMTFEQGGGGAGGLGALKAEGDTLTLEDRVLHHYTTGLSTLETASQNATRLVREFHQFYTDAVSNGSGEYKTYIIKNTPADAQRFQALLDLLDRNRIQYGTVGAPGSGRGYSYQSGREEMCSYATGDLVISALQPKSTLLRVLFEPRSHLVDSATYDITAWGLPYVYGLTAYAMRDRVAAGAGSLRPAFQPNPVRDAYGYVIRWEGVRSARAVGQLLQEGVRLRFVQEPFESGGQQFERGSVLVLRSGNAAFTQTLDKLAADACNASQVALYPVSSGLVDKGPDFGSSKVSPLAAPRVALATGDGVSSGAAGEIWHFFEQELGYPLTLINAADLMRANWDQMDVLILPDGNYRYLADKRSSDQLQDWISRGGRVIALEGAMAQLARLDWVSIKPKKSEDSSENRDDYAALKKYGDRERDQLAGSMPGSIFRVELDNTNPLAYGYPPYYYTLKLDDHIYQFIKEGGWNAGVIKKQEPVSGFVGSHLKPWLQDGLVFGTQPLGRGTLVCLADDILFRDFWENGKLMLCNAVFLVGQ